MRAIGRFTVRPVLPEALTALGELAQNLRWSWHPETQGVFGEVDPELWESTGRDPVKLLGAVSRRRFDELAADEGFLGRLGAVRGRPGGVPLRATAGTSAAVTGRPGRGHRATSRRSSASPPCCRSTPAAWASWPATTSRPPATSACRSSGSGCSTGTATSSSRCPARAGSRRPTRSWTPTACRSPRCCEADGAPATIRIDLPGGPPLVARIWVASVGRVPLLMLDTDVEGNPDHYVDVTDRLYGGNSEHRLRQELLLGVGGVRALRAYSPDHRRPDPGGVPHQRGARRVPGPRADPRAHRRRGRPEVDFETALEMGRASTVFTTHTPVPAGIDRFPRTLIEQYFSQGGATPGVPIDRILALGTEDYDGGDASVFNMAVMGFRLAQRANGVSVLHGEVSRGMFSGLWPAFDEAEVPIGSITNGVHAPTWVAPEVVRPGRRPGRRPDGDDTEAFWAAVDKVPSPDIWAVKRAAARAAGRRRAQAVAQVVAAAGRAKAELGWIDSALDPDVLTIGFARRAASYKRLTLMMRDPTRLKALLLHPERPIQLVIAGKAHPADDGGKKLIQDIVQLSEDPRSGTGSCSCPTTTSRWPSRCTPAATSG